MAGRLQCLAFCRFYVQISSSLGLKRRAWSFDFNGDMADYDQIKILLDAWSCVLQEKIDSDAPICCFAKVASRSYWLDQVADR